MQGNLKLLSVGLVSFTKVIVMNIIKLLSTFLQHECFTDEGSNC